MKSLMKPLLLVIGVALLAALGTTPLMAQTLVDPATLFIGNPLTCPLGAGCPAFNGEAVVVPSTSINLYENGGPADKFATLFLLVGVPNGGSAPKITSPAAYSPTKVGTNLSTSTVATNTGYIDIGLPGNGSQNLGSNWAPWDAAFGVTASSFNIFEYNLSGTPRPSATPPAFMLGGGLRGGSCVYAGGCLLTGAPAAGPRRPTFSPPFTEAGIVKGGPPPVP